MAERCGLLPVAALENRDLSYRGELFRSERRQDWDDEFASGIGEPTNSDWTLGTGRPGTRLCKRRTSGRCQSDVYPCSLPTRRSQNDSSALRLCQRAMDWAAPLSS